MENTGGLRHGIGDIVVYRNSGIYRINDIRQENFCGIGERTYYVMHSIYENNSIIYLPVDAKDLKIKIRRAMRPEEIDSIVETAKNSANVWKEDVKERAECFDELLTRGSPADLLWLLSVLTEHKNEIEGQRRRLYASDARILAAAEKIVAEEFSFALGVGQDEAMTYISERMEDIRTEGCGK
ncbi:MAG: CarD family transcriptional regulator [Eubacteriales bacterium]|jgi:RNA polymerase-interacting CarD/CdnL/TRCF family regulator